MPGFTPRFTISHAITGALTAIERARGFLEAATLSEAWIERMSQRALLLEAHHTTHIEGTELTLDEAARLWAGESVAGAKRDDVRELRDLKLLLDKDLIQGSGAAAVTDPNRSYVPVLDRPSARGRTREL